MIIRLDHIPHPGETVLGSEFITAAGGKGANQAVGAARAGGDVTFVARVGRDVFGDQAIKGFRRDGIRVEAVFRDAKRPSGVALIFVARDGENSIAVASGANSLLSPADVRRARAAFRGAAVLLMQLETPMPAVAEAARLAQDEGVLTILNPAPARDLPDHLLKEISILTPNESEAEILSGTKVRDESSAITAARKLRQRGVKTVILTLGARGALVCNANGEILVPGYKVKSVDTTAAGDVFNGALAVNLGEGEQLVDAVRFANAAAAISVTQLGAQPSAPQRKEIDAFLKTHPRRRPVMVSGRRPRK
jgi:ribokinase